MKAFSYRKSLSGQSLSKKLSTITLALTLSIIPLHSTLAQQAMPVPDAVAIAMPSPAEVKLAEASLAAYISSLSGDMLTIAEKYPALIEVRPPRANTAIIPNLSRQFFEKHNNNLAVAQNGDIEVLFMGDSITDFWRNETGNYAGKPVMDSHFPDLKIANFGIAGDTTQGVLYRLENGEAEGYSPKAIMLMIGTNNTRANSAEEISEGVGAIVLELQDNFPAAKILLLGIFPRSTHDDPVRETLASINTSIARLDDNENVFYLDIGDVFLDSAGDIPQDVMSDGLHPTTKGYELWATAVEEPLRDLLD